MWKSKGPPWQQSMACCEMLWAISKTPSGVLPLHSQVVGGISQGIGEGSADLEWVSSSHSISLWLFTQFRGTEWAVQFNLPQVAYASMFTWFCDSYRAQSESLTRLVCYSFTVDHHALKGSAQHWFFCWESLTVQCTLRPWFSFLIA